MWQLAGKCAAVASFLVLGQSRSVKAAPVRGFATYRKQNRDRAVVEGTPSLDGVFGGVFTGSGGPQVAGYLQQNAKATFERLYATTKGNENERIKQALSMTFDQLEMKLLAAAKKPAEFGFPQVVYTGSTALAAVVTHSYFILANSGDSQAVLISNFDGIQTATNLCSIHSVKNMEEAKRLTEKFGRGTIENSKVRGRVEVTRGFGLFDLKYKEFDNPKEFDELQGFQKSKDKFSGPYLSHRPEFVMRAVAAEDRFLLLGSSGFWNAMTPEDAATLLDGVDNPQEAAEKLVNVAKVKQTHYQVLGKSVKSTPDFSDMTVVVVKLGPK